MMDAGVDTHQFLSDRINDLRSAAFGEGFDIGDERHVRRADRILHAFFRKKGDKTGTWASILELRRGSIRHRSATQFVEGTKKFDALAKDARSALWSRYTFSWNARTPKTGIGAPADPPTYKQLQFRFYEPQSEDVGRTVFGKKKLSRGQLLRNKYSKLHEELIIQKVKAAGNDELVDQLSGRIDRIHRALRTHKERPPSVHSPVSSVSDARVGNTVFGVGYEDEMMSQAERVASRTTVGQRTVRKVASQATVGARVTQRSIAQEFTQDVASRTISGAMNAYRSGGEVILGAVEEALNLAKGLRDLSPEERKELLRGTLRPLRTAYREVRTKGPLGLLNAAETTFRKAGQTSDSVGAADFQWIRSLVNNRDGLSISVSDTRLLRAVLGRMNNISQLEKVAEGVDPGKTSAALEAGSDAEKIRRLKAIISDKISRIPNETLHEAYSAGGAASTVKNISRQKKIHVDPLRRELSRMLNEQLNLKNPNLRRDEVRMSRMRRGIFHAQVGGLAQVRDIGAKSAGRRVFSLMGGYSLSDVARGLDTVSDGFVTPGVTNAMGLTEQSFVRMASSGAFEDGVFGFNPAKGSLGEFVVKTVSTGIDAAGKTILKDMVHLTFNMDENDAKKLDEMSRSAYRRALSFDIETSYGKRRWERSFAENMHPMTDLEQEGVLEGVHNLYETRARALTEEFSDLVDSGDAAAIVAKYNDLVDSEGVDTITQMSFAEFSNRGELGSEIGTMRTHRLKTIGAKNVGRHAEDVLTSDEFEEGLLYLIKEQKTQSRLRGTLIGLNIDQYDMRVVRLQAWREGQMFLAKQKLIETALTKADDKEAFTRLLSSAGIDATTSTHEQLRLMAKEFEKRAGIRLAYSGSFNARTQQWAAAEGAAVAKAREMLGLSYTSPVSEAIHTGDVTALWRQFVTDSRGGKEAWANGALERATLHIAGDGGVSGSGLVRTKNGILKSQSAVTWGVRGQKVQDRMLSVFANVDKNEIERIYGLAKAEKGADLHTLNQIFKGYSDGISRLEGVDEVKVQNELERMRRIWAESKIADAKRKVIGSIASQESALYTRKDIFDSMLSGKLKMPDGSSFFEASAHVAARDVYMTKYMIDEAFSTAKRLKRYVAGAIQEVPDEMAAILKKHRWFGASAGFQSEPNTMGARAVSLATDMMFVEGETPTLTQLESLESRSVLKTVISDRVGDAFHNRIDKAAKKAAEELSEALGETIDPEMISKLSKRAIGVGALVAVGAGVIAAGTIHHRNKQYDDIWEYGETETEPQANIRRTTQRTADMGRLTTEMSTRRNYSFNMRNDKHDHLFRR